MKLFEIIDENEKKSIGVLIYYERAKEFIVELDDSLDEWTAPLLFSNLVKQQVYTMPRHISAMWVKGRIIPSNRQNIRGILKFHKMVSYDEMRLLELSGGKCSQDSLYIRKINELPDYVLKRENKKLSECIACDSHRLLCFFRDESIRIVDLNDLKDMEDVSKVLMNHQLYKSCKVGTGGYCVTFNDSIDIAASVLYESGEKVPLRKEDFMSFTHSNLLDTSESCEMLECSRQNIAYMIAQKQLKPVKESVKGNLFLKGDVVKNTW